LTALPAGRFAAWLSPDPQSGALAAEEAKGKPKMPKRFPAGMLPSHAGILAWFAMPRFLYSLLLAFSMPIILLRLLWKARGQGGYLAHLGERFGFFAGRRQGPCIWLHAVSLGETRAAFPLVDALLEGNPGHAVLLTHMTPTGRAAGLACYGGNPRVCQAWLPYDTPCAMRRFFAFFKPEYGILMETEIWPNLAAAARRAKVPLLLANARLSKRSARGYAKVGALVRPAFRQIAVAAQSLADARRFRVLGARQVAVCGNLKFDVAPAQGLLEQGQAWKAALGGRPVWLAASTREGEEGLILAIHRRLLGQVPRLLLVLVPRHPERFAGIAGQIEAAGFSFARRSKGPAGNSQVWLGDSLGELPAYYAMADVAFIGGSLMPFGGQNLIEAAACGTPVLMGPSAFNFSEALRKAKAFGAAKQVGNADALFLALSSLLADPGSLRAMQAACAPFVEGQRGALGRILAFAKEAMAPAGGGGRA
jgi:3-deoxy-D-manno-octulosonic-acid transferase